ncbi:MAG: protein translocase subunit SecF [Candidatus Magasanikbacteria bacterium]|jgi:preprotein translocase subunit SecF|nr:protein translocase subunit SecF [Candidatus Magasanikbacteria bacterium]MBT4314738.1 protein translocase subunit SecF [Candidatus Magasanikbacteria bacterium]MBT4547515.1 protein translocase subunit SecF [Candidatus Magasanikbacteria bacterium]MBT6819419.1 protein translocase subunit SecF [Candidatus Magasanikbacteria bacterium]
MINLIKYKKVPFVISSVLFVVSLILIFTIGLRPGIDFTGGSLMEITFSSERPTIDQVKESLGQLDLGLGEPVIQPTGEKGMIIRVQYMGEDEHQEVLSNLRKSFETSPSEEIVILESEGLEEGVDIADVELAIENKVWEERIETIGPAISAQLKSRAIYAVIAVVIAIIVYVAYAFRKVSKPVKSWKYGISAVIALIHDVTLTMGIFVLLGKYLNVEIGIPFVVALLTILGYSVNDTIVVFDRVRENLIKRSADKFAEMVNLGVNQTILRSINTSVTTLVVLFSLFLFGGESIKYFALALIVGIASGTYSSIFLASPLLVVWEELTHRRK